MNTLVEITLEELLSLKHSAKQFSLRRLRLKNQGQKVCRLLARGMEFETSRRYLPGDDVRNIDWRVTARTGKAHTKLFSEEKDRQILLVADMRSTMFFATKGVFKSVQASFLASYIGWNAIENGDRLGGLIFDEEDYFEFKPAHGKRGLLPYLQSLALKNKGSSLKKQTTTLEKIVCLDLAINNLKKLATPGSFIFMAGDFRHFSKQAKDQLVQISKHSDLLLCFIYDPLEADFHKKGEYPVTDGNKNLQLAGQTVKSLEKYRQQFMDRKNQVAELKNHPRIHFIECSTEDDCLDKLRTIFQVK